MPHLIPGNQKHLSLKDMEYIYEALNDGRFFKDIAKFLCKDPTTISKEVKLHRSMNTWNKGSFNNPQNFCLKRFNCRKTNVCDKLFVCDRKGRGCLIIPVLFEPLVRTSRATIPENESHIFRRFGATLGSIT